MPYFKTCTLLIGEWCLQLLSVYTRGDFPGLGSYQSYLNTAVVGLVPRSVREKALGFLLDFINNPLGKGKEAQEVHRQVRNLFSTYIGLEREKNITVFNSTTDCILSIISSIMIEYFERTGRKTTIGVTQQEFPGVVLAVRSLCKSLDKYCEKVVYVGGTIEWEDEAGSFLDKSGRVLVASSVQWTTGYRGNLENLISKEFPGEDSHIVLDIAQHVGQAPVPLNMKYASALCGTSIKWMLAPVSGIGIGYVSDRLLSENYRPLAYTLRNLAIDNIDTFYINPLKDMLKSVPPLSSSALKYLPVGRPSLYSIELFLEALRYLLSISPMAVEDHIMGLRKMLVEMIEDLGLREFLEGYNYRSKTGIVLVETGLTPHKEFEIVNYLMRRGIAVSARGQAGIHGIRVSIHLYNNERDLYLFVQELKKAIQTIG